MNQIRPEVASMLAEHFDELLKTPGRLSSSLETNPCWYWLDYNAEHGASKEVVSWMLKDAERYEELVKR